MQLEIITPETLIFKGEAKSVQLPGLDGSFQVLNNHAPIISGLKNGTIKADLEVAVKTTGKLHSSVTTENHGKIIHVAIKGGVVEMQNNKIIVLAE
ncbi:MAG TPA: F0F1 ATP synthase subunit epsilon [Fluviicola sp.]|nr:F0F1 ATP synthase subunit epsilon [Fluviicola sp.]